MLAIRAKNISSTTKLFGASKHEKALSDFYESGRAQKCLHNNSAHISAHNAVKISDAETKEAVAEALRKKRHRELEDAYGKACERGKAKGWPMPPRDSYLPPYMSSGMMTGVYFAGDPCVMPMGKGMVGACAAGTCSGGIAAGGCSGPGGFGNGGGCSGAGGNNFGTVGM